MEYTNIQMVIVIMDNFSKIKNLDKDSIISFLEIIIRGILKREKDQDMVLWILIMVIIIKDIGKLEWNMVKEYMYGVMELNIKEVSGLIKDKGKVKSNI
jgi:hypothetical protein